MYLDKDKLQIICRALREHSADAWLITGRESIMKSEPVLPVLGDMEFIIATSLIFTAEGKCIAVVSPLDAEGYRQIDGIDEVYAYKTTMADELYSVLGRLRPGTLALDYSESDAAADGLTLGMYRMLKEVFDRLDHAPEIISAGPIISDVRGQKTPSQVSRIRHCAVKADEFLRRVPEICGKGTTSLDIFQFLQKTAFDEGYGMSWAESQCPGISVDPNVPAGHMGIVSTPIVPGYVINIDYGVSRDGYCSDLQRMYYVLKEDEEDAPEDLKTAFYLVRDAVRAAKEFMRPGVTGFEVDQIARHMIVDEGYDSWNAALGHQVGHQTHDGGTILANRRPRYNRRELIDTPLKKGNVFTIEPSIVTKWGKIGIEEDVVITDSGTEWLTEPQQELILIRI